MNVILCGYNWSGCKALDILIKRNYNVFVYTCESQYYVPDLVQLCKDRNISYSLDKINSENLPFLPDIICSIYYPYIIDNGVISLVNNKIFNLHPSLLPNYKGCSSLTWAMINGENEVGYTYHYINEKIDRGNIIFQKKIVLEDWDLQVNLYNRVMFEAILEFENVFDRVISGYVGEPQNQLGKYYKRGCPYDGEIDELWDENKIKRFIRAMINPPLNLAQYKGITIKNFKEFINIRDEK
ncbi:formyl transferase [Sandaracinomonas limnophila]|uniref:Formyl transferase n=1 Tax=Sandaracinomonas limnophila TaxID=1862386 RepID=A0A437PTM3_9BACT|nr:formyltransferase family protein [Sandaracinomonas limnophila]RVU25604.1 formyl transferase [Sandaracinomonas limnophila]